MNPFKTRQLEAINFQRCSLFGTAAVTIAAAQLVMSGSVDAQSAGKKPVDLPKIRPGTNTSFGPLKQIDAGVLGIGYAEAGPAHGPAVILLHGRPLRHSQFRRCHAFAGCGGLQSHRLIFARLQGTVAERGHVQAPWLNAVLSN